LSALQALVAQLAGCFYALTPFEQQVLVVRTGIDGRQPVSRTMLASALGTTPARIAQTERTAIRELDHASRTDGCMPFAAAASLFTAASAFVGGPFGPLGYVTPAIASTGRPGLTPPSASEDATFASGTSSLAERLAGLEDGGKAGPLWMIILISLMFFLAAAALGREVRRSVH
jgi:hypothetical protein